ncbi:MAG: hypothetical protein ACE1ZQ_02815 [Ignavibacteriaceae bacterium]
MTAKEHVKGKYPKAIVKRFKQNGISGEIYWLCFSSYFGFRLSEGKTESKAWVNAKKFIIDHG